MYPVYVRVSAPVSDTESVAVTLTLESYNVGKDDSGYSWVRLGKQGILTWWMSDARRLRMSSTYIGYEVLPWNTRAY